LLGDHNRFHSVNAIYARYYFVPTQPFNGSSDHYWTQRQ